MRTMKRQQLTETLEGLTRFRISEEARATHIDAISEAIIAAPLGAAAGRTSWLTPLRRRITGLLVATMTLGPAGVAFAAQGSLPGDSLYPAKRVAEHVQAVFDPSLPARHRLDEASELLARGAGSAEVAQALQEAVGAVAIAPDDGSLSAALEALQQELEPSATAPSAEPIEPSLEPSEADTGDASSSVEIQEPPEASDEPTVSSPESDEPAASEPTETTEVGESEADESPEAAPSDESEHSESET